MQEVTGSIPVSPTMSVGKPLDEGFLFTTRSGRSRLIGGQIGLPIGGEYYKLVCSIDPVNYPDTVLL